MKPLHVGGLAGVVFLGVLACTPSPSQKSEIIVGAGHDASVACLADPTWFKKKLTTEFPDPATFSSANNCNFHLWSWQTFLALMSPANVHMPNGPRVFEQLGYPADLFRPGGPKKVYPGRSLSEKATYSINQAGPGDNVLIDQKQQMVYYSVFANKVYWNFIADNRYYHLRKLKSPEAKEALFKLGSLELKVSWRVAEDLDTGTVYIDDANDYYTIEATVPTYAVKHSVVVAQKETRKVRLAMVGMHVVGVVKGHPEFIWATFEHLSNAPNNVPGNPATEGPFGAKLGSWSFYKPGTNSDACNIFDDSAPTSPVNVTRLDLWGGGLPTNTSNIIDLNKSVWGLLPAERKLLKNYFQAGAIWTTGTLPLSNAGFPPGVDAKKTFKGSFQLDNPQAGIANTTMETFTQMQNCFYCHNAGQHSVAVLQPDGTQLATTVDAKPLNLSHFVVNYQAEQQLESKKKGNK